MLGQAELNELRLQRASLVEPVRKLAVERCELPEDSELLLLDRGGGGSKPVRGGRRELVIKNGQVSRLGYFSLRRRRKKDYNEVLRLWDVVDM